MIVKFHKNFNKKLKKLSPKFQTKTEITIKIFRQNPHDPVLENHALHGKMQGQRSFSVTGDIRIIFEEYNNYVLVLFLDIGPHPKVYK